MKKLLLLAVPVLATIALLFGSLSSTPASASSAAPANLVGTWQLTLDNDPTPTFLMTFNEGGTIVSAGPSTGVSSGHGSWRRTGPDTFSTGERSFIYDPTVENIVFLQDLEMSLTVLPDNGGLVGNAQISVLFPDGLFINGATAQVTGERIAFDILP